MQYGFLDTLSTKPYTDMAAAPNMMGVGFTPEATDMIPSQVRPWLYAVLCPAP